MKIIRIISTSPSPLDIDIHPDSAILLPGRPLFMPEWGEGWEAVLHPAVRIGRLGKNISRKFASRYYDGLTVGLRVTLSDAAGREGVLSGMDSTIITGEWLAPDAATRGLAVGVGDRTVTVGPLASQIDEAIAAVSEYMTLKMGDVILLPRIAPGIPVSEGMKLPVTADGVQVVELRVV